MFDYFFPSTLAQTSNNNLTFSLEKRKLKRLLHFFGFSMKQFSETFFT